MPPPRHARVMPSSSQHAAAVFSRRFHAQRFPRPSRRRNPNSNLTAATSLPIDDDDDDESCSSADVAQFHSPHFPTICPNPSATDRSTGTFAPSTQTCFAPSAQTPFPAFLFIRAQGPPIRSIDLRSTGQLRPRLIAKLQRHRAQDRDDAAARGMRCDRGCRAASSSRESKQKNRRAASSSS
eukprot:6203057-Pleurochrysis_carterae.AAC.1